MKSKTILKILLDAGMTVVYVLLMFDLGDGNFFHEVAGLAVALLFAAHVWLNWKSVAALMQKARRGEGTLQTNARLALDLILPVAMLAAIGTGVLIARAVFVIPTGMNWNTIYLVHVAASWTGLMCLTAHLLQHTRYLAAVVPACLRSVQTSEVRKTVGRFAAGVLAACALYAGTFCIWQNANTASAAVNQQASALQQQGDQDATKADAILPDSQTETAHGQNGRGGKKRRDGKGQKQKNGSDSDNGQNKDGSSGDSDSGNGTPSTGGTPTLSQFLSSMTCTGCGKHCLLSNPRCGKGIVQQEQATQQYQATYGDE